MRGKLGEKDLQIADLIKRQQRFEQLIQSLIDSGQHIMLLGQLRLSDLSPKSSPDGYVEIRKLGLKTV